MQVGDKIKIKSKSYLDMMPNMTFNKVYTILSIKTYPARVFYVKNDSGYEVGFMSYRFISLKDAREKRLERLV